MTKAEYLSALENRLRGLPTDDVREHISFYSEMIEDRIEEGLTEGDAIREIGDVKKVASQIIADIPLMRIAKEKLKPKRRIEAWEAALIVLGSPLWISLAAATFTVIISLYIAVFSVVLSLWAIFASLAVTAIAGILAGPVIIFTDGAFPGLFLISAALVAAGLAIFAFFGCIYASRGAWRLVRASVIGIKKLFIR